MNLDKFIQNDKRKAIRIDVKINCVLIFNEEEITGFINNISESGALIKTKTNIPNFNTLKIFFVFGEKEFALFCKVVKKENYFLTVKFVYDHNDDNRKKINNVLRIIDLGENFE